MALMNPTPTYAQLLDWYYQQQMKQFQPQPTQTVQPIQQAPQQIQDGGFMVMPSEEAALKYPIAPGNSITFKIENQPLIIEKTMGFSKMEGPQIKYFDLKERKSALMEEQPLEHVDYALKADIDKLKTEIEDLKRRLQEDDGV